MDDFSGLEYDQESVSEIGEEVDVVSKTNQLLNNFNLPTQVSRIEDITSSLFVVLYESLFSDRLPGVVRDPDNKEDEIQNCQIVIDILSADIIKDNLTHIKGADIVEGKVQAISNLLDIFSFLYEYVIKQIESDVPTDAEDEGSELDKQGFEGELNMMAAGPYTGDYMRTGEFGSAESGACGLITPENLVSPGLGDAPSYPEGGDAAKPQLEAVPTGAALLLPIIPDVSASPHGEGTLDSTEELIKEGEQVEQLLKEDRHGFKGLWKEGGDGYRKEFDFIGVRPAPTTVTVGRVARSSPTPPTVSGAGGDAILNSTPPIGSTMFPGGPVSSASMEIPSSLPYQDEPHNFSATVPLPEKEKIFETPMRATVGAASNYTRLEPERPYSSRESPIKGLSTSYEDLHNMVQQTAAMTRAALSSSPMRRLQDPADLLDITDLNRERHPVADTEAGTLAKVLNGPDPYSSSHKLLDSYPPYREQLDPLPHYSDKELTQKTSFTRYSDKELAKESSYTSYSDKELAQKHSSTSNSDKELVQKSSYTTCSERAPAQKQSYTSYSDKEIAEKANYTMLERESYRGGPIPPNTDYSAGTAARPSSRASSGSQRLRSRTTKQPSSVSSHTAKQPSSVSSRTATRPSSITSHTAKQPSSVSSRTATRPSSVASRATLPPSAVSSRSSLRKDTVTGSRPKERKAHFTEDFVSTGSEHGYVSDSPRRSVTTTTSVATEDARSHKMAVARCRREKNKHLQDRLSGRLTEMGKPMLADAQRFVEAENHTYDDRQEFLKKLYAEEFQDVVEEVKNLMGKDKVLRNDMEQEYRKLMMVATGQPTKKDKPAQKPKGYLLPKTKRQKSVQLTPSPRCASKKTSSTTSMPEPRARPLSVGEEEELMPALLEEFPYLQMTDNSWHELWRKGISQIESLTKAYEDHKKRKSKAQIQLEEAARKHEVLASIVKKQMDHNERMNQLKDQKKQEVMMRNKLHDKRTQSARARRYYNEYQVRSRSKLLKRQTKEEQIFKKLFKDGLAIQKERIQDVRRYAKEQREQQAQKRQDEIDSLENYYRDQFEMLVGRLIKDRQHMVSRDKAHQKVLEHMKRELRRKMEQEIVEIQSQILQDDDDTYFRQLEADRLRQELHIAKYQTRV